LYKEITLLGTECLTSAFTIDFDLHRETLYCITSPLFDMHCSAIKVYHQNQTSPEDSELALSRLQETVTALHAEEAKDRQMKLSKELLHYREITAGATDTDGVNTGSVAMDTGATMSCDSHVTYGDFVAGIDAPSVVDSFKTRLKQL